jgi:hypothetical protein
MGELLKPEKLEIFDKGDVFVPEQVELLCVVATGDCWIVVVVELKHVEQYPQKLPELRSSAAEDLFEIGQRIGVIRRSSHKIF